VRIGVDLGGTKIEIIALDDDGAPVLRRRVLTPVGDYSGTIRAIAELVRSAQSQIGASATVGIATPGALSPPVCCVIQIALCSMASPWTGTLPTP
jgi:predicted NBD/HSP70 family sugar kinase